MIDNNIMPTSGPRQIDPITLAKIKQKSQEREYEIVDDPVGRIKLKTFSSEDSQLRNKKVFTYYCSLCGELAIVTSCSLTKTPRRRTDKSLILVDSEENAVQRYMDSGASKIIKRTGGIEKQWAWECRNCKVELAYQVVPHEAQMISEVVPLFASSPCKVNLYILGKSLATDPKYAEVYKKLKPKTKP